MEAMALATTNSLKELKNKKKRASLFTTTTHMKHIPHICNVILKRMLSLRMIFNKKLKSQYTSLNHSLNAQ